MAASISQSLPDSETGPDSSDSQLKPSLIGKIEAGNDRVTVGILLAKEDGVLTIGDDRFLNKTYAAFCTIVCT